MQASLQMQRFAADIQICIERSERCYALSRERLKATEHLRYTVSKRAAVVTTVTPGSLSGSSLRHVLLLSGGQFHIEECICGREYAFARYLNAGLIGIYERRDEAEAAARKFSTGQRSSMF
jgi:hypothetical protein